MIELVSPYTFGKPPWKAAFEHAVRISVEQQAMAIADRAVCLELFGGTRDDFRLERLLARHAGRSERSPWRR